MPEDTLSYANNEFLKMLRKKVIPHKLLHKKKKVKVQFTSAKIRCQIYGPLKIGNDKKIDAT